MAATEEHCSAKRRILSLSYPPPIIKQQLSAVQELVYRAFSVGAGYEDLLAGELFRQGVTDFELAIIREAQAAGYTVPGRLALSDKTVLADLRGRAQFAARSISDTYNAEMRRQIGRIGEDVASANRATYLKRLSDWDSARWEKHSPGISVTELQTARNYAQVDFIYRNGLTGRARVDPQGAVCPVCEGYVAEGWVSLEEGYTWPLPVHPSCLVAGTPVVPLGAVLAASRMAYAGPLRELRTESGAKLMLTPNHEVLTARGWLAAKLVREGDTVFRSLSQVEVTGPEINDRPTLIDEIFSTLAQRRPPARRVASSHDFHGDGHFGKGEIEIVLAHGELPSVAHPHGIEQGCELILSMAGEKALPLTGLGSGQERRQLPWSASVARPSALAGAGTGHDSPSSQDIAHTAWADAPSFSDLAHGLASEVIADHVVVAETIQQPNVAHVYDLQTTRGAYLANGILVHNCVHSLEVEYEGERPESPWLGGEVEATD